MNQSSKVNTQAATRRTKGCEQVQSPKPRSRKGPDLEARGVNKNHEVWTDPWGSQPWFETKRCEQEPRGANSTRVVHFVSALEQNRIPWFWTLLEYVERILLCPLQAASGMIFSSRNFNSFSENSDGSGTKKNSSLNDVNLWNYGKHNVTYVELRKVT